MYTIMQYFIFNKEIICCYTYLNCFTQRGLICGRNSVRVVCSGALGIIVKTKRSKNIHSTLYFALFSRQRNRIKRLNSNDFQVYYTL